MADAQSYAAEMQQQLQHQLQQQQMQVQQQHHAAAAAAAAAYGVHPLQSGSHPIRRLKPAAHAPHAPSKVLHIRGLPPYTSESDLLAFFSALSVGVVPTRILILPNSNQAFVQLNSIEAASALLQLQAVQGGNFVLKGNKTIIVQYSNRQEIHTPITQQQQQQQQQAQAAAAAAASSSVAAHPAAAAGGVMMNVGPDSQPSANSILLVTVLNTRVPVTLDHIHQIFKPYGDVLRIVTFHKNGVFKALVQLGSVEAAVNARLMMEGREIFQGCCHLRIGFSSLPELHVKTPGNNARDFTTPSGATQGFGAEGGAYSNAANAYQQQAGLIGGGTGYGAGVAAYQDPTYHAAAAHVHAASVAPPHPHAPGCVVLVSNLPETRVSCDILFTLFGVYGDVQRVKILYNKRDTALVQYVSPQSAYLAALHLNHLHLYGKTISVTPSKHIEVSLPKSIPNGGTQADHEQQQSGLTQDYTHSPIHRFKRSSGAASAAGVGGGLGIHAKSIHPPSQVLHVSSLADAVTEDELRQLFSSLSVPAHLNGESSSADEEKVSQHPPVVQFFTSTPRPLVSVPGVPPPPVKPSKQAFLRFESVASAVENLIEFHNYNLHGRYLRISFSHKDPAQVHETINGMPIQSPSSTQETHDQQQMQLQPVASSASSGATVANIPGGSTAAEGQSTHTE